MKTKKIKSCGIEVTVKLDAVNKPSTIYLLSNMMNGDNAAMQSVAPLFDRLIVEDALEIMDKLEEANPEADEDMAATFLKEIFEAVGLKN